jgi:hypothetical protein
MYYPIKPNLIINSAHPTSEEDIEALKTGTFYSFANNPSKLKILGLWGCGYDDRNNWADHPERLEGLLSAMAKVPIKHSLEKIWVLACAVSKQQVLEMVEKHGFTNIKEIDSYY